MREDRIIRFAPYSQPKIMGSICAIALERGIEVEFTRQLIKTLNLLPASLEIQNWPWPVKVSTLGAFKLELDDETVAFSGRAPKKTLGLLKAIVAFGGAGVSSEKLVDALWRDSDGAAAQEALQVALVRLQQAARP